LKLFYFEPLILKKACKFETMWFYCVVLKLFVSVGDLSVLIVLNSLIVTIE
jgi:hypothetical protein